QQGSGRKKLGQSRALGLYDFCSHSKLCGQWQVCAFCAPSHTLAVCVLRPSCHAV
ncbi:hypothetical protein LEMLEM_LOCUS3772, partial [Lemmus lemmus]